MVIAKDTYKLGTNVDDILGYQEDQGIHFTGDRDGEFGFITQFLSTFDPAIMDVRTILLLHLIISVGSHLLHKRRVDNTRFEGIEEVQEPNTGTNRRILEAADGRRAGLVR